MRSLGLVEVPDGPIIHPDLSNNCRETKKTIEIHVDLPIKNGDCP